MTYQVPIRFRRSLQQLVNTGRVGYVWMYNAILCPIIEPSKGSLMRDERAFGALVFVVSMTLFLLAGISGCDSIDHADRDAKNTFIKVNGQTMGTTYSIQVDRLPQGMNFTELLTELEMRLQSFTQLYSTYEKDSLINDFNQSKELGWFNVPIGFVDQVSTANRISQASAGAFDITVQPLVQLWGFGPTIVTHKPDADKIQAVLKNTGYEYLEVREKPPAIRKTKPQLQIDLSSIAKGTAIDELADWLNSMQIENWLIEIGGELRAKGFNQDKSAWQIGIQRPNSERLEAEIVLPLTNEAVATSGDYENYFVEDGIRYSHLINPVTGYPVTHQTTSVSVIAKTTAIADAWATTLLIMGKDAGMILATEESLAAIFIERIDDRFQITATPTLQLQKTLSFD